MPLPNKIQYRDLSPELKSLISGEEVTGGALNEVLKLYRKKTDVIAETDLATDYRNAVNDKINRVKIDFENFVNSLNVIPEDKLSPEFLQRISDIELQISGMSEIADCSKSILDLQSDLASLKSQVENDTDLSNVQQKLSDIDNTLQEYQTKISTLDSNFTQNKQSLDVDIQGLKADLASLKTTVEGSLDFTAVDQHINDVDASLNDIKREIIGLQDKLRQLEQMVDALKDSNDKLQQSVNDLNDANIEFKQDIQVFRSELDNKRNVHDSIKEDDLDDTILSNLRLATSAYNQLKLFLDSVESTSEGFAVGRNAAGGLTNKSLFIPFITLEEKTLDDLKQDAVQGQLVIEPKNGTVYMYRTKIADKEDAPVEYEFVEQEIFFSKNKTYWNSFLVNKDTNKIFAYVTENGQYLSFFVIDNNKYHLTANSSIVIPLTIKSCMNTEVLVKDNDKNSENYGYYINAEAYVNIIWGETNSKLINYSDQDLDVIVTTV